MHSYRVDKYNINDKMHTEIKYPSQPGTLINLQKSNTTMIWDFLKKPPALINFKTSFHFIVLTIAPQFEVL